MPVLLAPLPYALDALEPIISAETLEVHHGRHHRGYVERLNAAILGTELEPLPLEAIVRRSARGRTTARRATIFNNAAQAWNHEFYWQSLRPRGGKEPAGELAERIARDFGSHEAFTTAFKLAAIGVFGSGWAWLTADRGKLRIATTANADTPIAHGRHPLLVLDVWEHAYYLDHHERRAAHVAAVVDHLLDWDFAERNLRRWEAERAATFPGEAAHA
jgi:Fe-Mn family superoxide dismutase